jgi:transposase InsO family protein
VSDNGTQFASSTVIDFCKHLGIQTKSVSVIHPQANGQAESANKVILNGIKKKLEAAKSLWAEQLHEVRIVLKVNNFHIKFTLASTLFALLLRIVSKLIITFKLLCSI